MKEFFTNSWVIGIIGGILSGLIVTWLTRIIFSKKDNKEYLQKILQANKEVIYAIRPTISEGEIPSRQIINSLILSNSSRLGIDKNDMYSIEQICDELIKEVMDSSFISSKIKTEYCKDLLQLRNETNKLIEYNNLLQKQNVKSTLEYRQKLITYMTTMTGLIATFATFGLTILTSLNDDFKYRSFSSEYIFIVPAIIVIFVTVILAFVSTNIRTISKKTSKGKREEENKEEKTKIEIDK